MSIIFKPTHILQAWPKKENVLTSESLHFIYFFMNESCTNLPTNTSLSLHIYNPDPASTHHHLTWPQQTPTCFCLNHEVSEKFCAWVLLPSLHPSVTKLFYSIKRHWPRKKKQSAATNTLERRVTKTHDSANTLSHTQIILSVAHHAHCMAKKDSALIRLDMKVKCIFFVFLLSTYHWWRIITFYTSNLMLKKNNQ